MSGALWTMTDGDELAVQRSADAAGLIAAKTIGGGVIFVGPGLEALVLGAFGASQSLVRATNTGIYAISGFHMADILDPTKLLKWVIGSATGTTRTVTTPDWSGVLLLPADLGVAGQFLRSNGAGAQPTWNAVTLSNALLDGANHTDTLAGAVAAGDLIYGNATPKWARLGVGSAGQVLTVVAGAPAWSSSPSAVLHSSLLHIRAVRATGCTINNGSAVLTTSGSQFANVKVGDFVQIDAGGVDLQGSTVSVWTDANTVTLSRTKTTAGNLVNVVAVITPGDHWENTMTEVNGYMVAQGRGTYEPTANAAGTFQEIRGPLRWRGYNGAVSTDFRVDGSPSAVQPTGFMIMNGTTAGVRFLTSSISADRLYTLPNASDTVCLIGTTQTLDNKDLNLVNKIRTDGTASYTLFRTPGGADRLGFDISLATALRVASWPDFAGLVTLERAAITFADADTSPAVSGGRLFKTANTNPTSITTFDGGNPGEEITIIFGDANTTLVDGATLVMAGSANKTFASTDTWTGVYDGAVWYEKCRSIN